VGLRVRSPLVATKKKPNRPRPPGGSKPARPAGAKPARERTGPTKAERLAAAEAARRRKAARTRAVVAGVVAALAAVLVFVVVSKQRSNAKVTSKLEAGSCVTDTKSDGDNGSGQNHVNGDVTYKVNPPAGGNHNPTPAPPGQFTQQDAPPDAQIVHSLEHGYVAIWYRPDVGADTLAKLGDLASRYSRDVLLVPRPSLPQPVAATAWHHRLLCTQPDLSALELFVTTYRNQGPEKIPHT
jgi:hypothetical protein